MNILKLEWFKLYKRKSTKVLMIIYSSVLILQSFFYYYSEQSLGMNLFSAGQFTISSLKIMMAFILPFICLYIASNSFAQDLGRGTIKNMLLLPVSKGHLFYGKLVGVQCLIGVLLSIQFVYTMTVGLVMDGGVSFVVVGSYLGHYLGAFLILGLVNSLGALYYLLFSSAGLALLMTYLTYMAMTIAGIYIPQIKVISLGRIIQSYGTLLTQYNSTLLLSVIAYYILLITAGTFLFESKATKQIIEFE